MQATILVEGLSKKYFRYRGDRPRTFQDLFSRVGNRILKRDEFWALQDVSFQLSAGHMAGVIGRNGAGKSTLLRLVGGVGQADRGRITTQGRIGALVDLGAGFHPDLTGRENVFINGVISGLTRREVAQNFDSIVAFAELESFIDSPLRIYSLGMQMRLAFAVAVHIQPAILLIDEVLAVGDYAFHKKCLERIAQFKAQGCTILLVSHDTGLVSRLCDEVLWLEAGRLAAHGAAQEVVGQYLARMEAKTRWRTPDIQRVQSPSTDIDLKLNENRLGSQEMEIASVLLCDAQGQAIQTLDSGAALSVMIDYRAPTPLPAPIFGVTITRTDGVVCWEGNLQTPTPAGGSLQGKGRVILDLERLDLAQGNYYVDVGVYRHDWAYAYDYHWQIYTLEIRSPDYQKGLLLPPHSWKFERR